MIRWTDFESPFGPTFLAGTPKGVLRLTWGVEDPEAEAEALTEEFPLWGVKRAPDRLAEAGDQLRAYFAGEREQFDLSTDLRRLTPFQREVLEATAEIPYGRTVSYGDLAERIGRPDGSRAVGSALASNPVPIVIPCHRVVRSDGSPGGYTAGTGYKEQLLELETGG